MPDAGPDPKVLPLQHTPATLAARVRKLAANTANISWSAHALERMSERGIPDWVALEVLRSGMLRGGIENGKKPSECKIKMVKEVKGRREVGVVTLLVRDSRLLVKTVEWEDLS